MFITLTAASMALASVASATTLLNHTNLLSDVEDPEWFKSNIPLLEVPSQQIQDVYYYRWQSYREHLVYTGAQYGYMASEFLHPMFYGAPYGGISAAAGHHITEGRWVRDARYGEDVVNYWLAGPGQLSKPKEDAVNKDTSDWAHEYSFWAASAVWKLFLATGDKDFAVGQLGNLVAQYRGWDDHFDSDLGLYWQVPVWDATEYTAASYESDDPYHGGAGYRPTINAYQYGDAQAISAIAALKGDEDLAKEYKERAENLQKAAQSHLYDKDRQFFMHLPRDKVSDGLLTSREIMGYIPWMFNMPAQDFDTAAFSQLTDPEGFSAKYGPTMTERRSKWFMKDAKSGCCHWNGPSWPFSTAQTLTAVENVLNDYPSQKHINASDYVTLLGRYAATQHKDGKPHVAEAHDPDEDRWMYDSQDHSEDYNHSTYVDNIIAGLIGLRAQPDDTLVVNPLAPSSWEYFALENVPYHGHNVSVFWDKSGSRYNNGSGLKIFVDGDLASSSKDLERVTVNVGPGQPAPHSDPRLVNIAANGQNFSQLATAFASYTYSKDDAMRAIDGIVWRTGVPASSRWTSFDSPNAEDHMGVDLRRMQTVNSVRLFFYADGAGVELPSSYDVEYCANDKWVSVPFQSRSSAPTASNSGTTITFPEIETSKIRIVAPNSGGGKGWGLSEVEVWTAPIFKIRNQHSGKFMTGGDGSSGVQQEADDDGSKSRMWQFIPTAGGWYKVKNLESRMLLSVNGAAKGANSLLQIQDGDASGDLWRVESQDEGTFLLRNKDSTKVAGLSRKSKAKGVGIVQAKDNGAEGRSWSLLPATAAGFPEPDSAASTLSVRTSLNLALGIMTSLIVLQHAL